MAASSTDGPARWMQSRVTRRPDLKNLYYRRRVLVGGGAVLVLLLVAQLLTGSGGEDSSALATGDPERSETTDATSSGSEQSTTTLDPCPSADRSAPGEDEVPDDLVAALETASGDRSLTSRRTGVSIWIDGYGEVLSQSPELPLVPASNQKILTAMGVLELLDHDHRLTTEIRTSVAPDEDGIVFGDLWIVGGGDPLIKREGDHSLQDLATEVAATGLTAVTGEIYGDESRYDQIRKAPGWLEWEMPLPGGSQSALMVNSNSRIGDPSYLENPTAHNADLFRTALVEAGVEVGGGSAPGTAPAGATPIHRYDSPTVASMVETMLQESDNMAAEMLTKEIGLQVSGTGTWQAGMDAIVAGLEEALCLTVDGRNDDSSGISRDNQRSAGNWTDLLLAAHEMKWYPRFREGLPLAGAETGTLSGRFLGTEADGRVQAKTGSLGTSVALSGYATTASGRDVVFSVIVNGDQPEPAIPAMDALVVAATAHDD